MSWALNLAPVPADRGGQPSSACKFVLVGLANHARPDGTGIFPSVATLVRYTGLSERTVRTCLDRLAAEGIMRPCDPEIVAARIKRADRRPQGPPRGTSRGRLTVSLISSGSGPIAWLCRPDGRRAGMGGLG
jgi:Helix-turn-helix domain